VIAAFVYVALGLAGGASAKWVAFEILGVFDYGMVAWVYA
jgi:hypothetical protein